MNTGHKPSDLNIRIDMGGNETTVLSDQLPNNADQSVEENPAHLLAYGALDNTIDNRFNVAGFEDITDVLDYDAGDDILAEAMDGTVTEVLTGGLTESGMSEDLTTAEFSGARRMGGPTGGMLNGAGRGGGAHSADYARDYAEGVDMPMTPEKDTGLAAKVAAANTKAFYTS